MAAKETREEDVMHDDWVLSPDFPSLIALRNVYSVDKRIESCSRAQNVCGYQTMFDAFQVCGHLQVGSCKLPFIQVEIVVIKNT